MLFRRPNVEIVKGRKQVMIKTQIYTDVELLLEDKFRLKNADLTMNLSLLTIFCHGAANVGGVKHSIFKHKCTISSIALRPLSTRLERSPASCTISCRFYTRTEYTTNTSGLIV